MLEIMMTDTVFAWLALFLAAWTQAAVVLALAFILAPFLWAYEKLANLYLFLRPPQNLRIP